MLEDRKHDQKITPYERRVGPGPLRVYDPPPVQEAYEPQPTVREYVAILLRRRWTVLAVAAILTTLVAVWAFKMTPIYRATARLELDDSSHTSSSESVNETQPVASNDNYLHTQIEVLQADTVALHTIQRLKLGNNVNFISPEEMHKVQQESADRQEMKLIAEFKSKLQVRLVPETRVVDVSFEGPDPRLASQVVNALVENYIDYNFRQKYDATRQAAGRMEQQLDELKAKVESSQRALVDYQRQHSIVAVTDKQSVPQQRLQELSTQLTTAQSDRIQKEALYNEVRANPARAASLVQNDLLLKLQEDYAQLSQQYAEASLMYGKGYPKVIRLQKQMEQYQDQINRERDLVVERIRRDYNNARNRENLISGAVGSQKTELGAFSGLQVEQNILKGEFETNQALYQRLMQHLKDATVNAGLKSSDVHIVDSARPPLFPVRPRKLLYLMLALIGGLSLGMIVAFIQEGIDNSIKTPEEIESLVSLPTLAIIPKQSGILAAGGKSASARHLGAPPSPQLATITNPQSMLAESYRSLRSSTLLSLAQHPPQAILVTSASPEEGKTTTAMNLAMTLAQKENDVLLVDCDMRNPSVARSFHLDTTKGLSKVLSGSAILEESLQRFEKLPTLWILAAGTTPPNPAELLTSPKMDELMEEMRVRFQHIILDSPPVLLTSDAVNLATMVDGVIVVVESAKTSRKALIRTCKLLEGARAKILGVALNKVDMRFSGYYGSYGGAYGYGYGNKEQGK